jgi:hypothetical protein
MRFFVGDMKVVLCAFALAVWSPRCRITDPRDGMHKGVIEQILKLLRRIGLCSCNSATQTARFV